MKKEKQVEPHYTRPGYGDTPPPVRKTGSIARRVAWSFHWRELFRIVFYPILLGAAAIAVWCAAVEQVLLGHVLQDTYRNLYFAAETSVVTMETVRQMFQGQGVVNEYIFYAVGDPVQTVPMGNFLFWVVMAMGAVIAVDFVGWIFSYHGVIRRVRRFLKPIDDIAQVTESISSRGFDESKFHSLETAIDELNGLSEDEQLHIGDDDLAGLETAVNNLILRMHSSYRQQVRFVDDASHELRTPIAVIQGYADMLDRWGKTDEQVLEESIRAIRTETEHMKTLVEQLLFLARGDAGRQKLDMQRLDLSELAGEVIDESRMIDPDHEYILKAESPVFVRGDEAMLKQAVRVLVENSRKYSPKESRITLRTSSEAGKARLAVQDNGIGVKVEDARRMFDRFYRADAARNSETGGSGLGLSIARWIVGRHQGSFWVKSYEDIGTRITIELPLWKE